MPYPAPTGPSDAVPKPFKTGQDKSYPTGRIISKLTAITGGEPPTEAEHNAVRTKLNEIIDILATAGFATRDTDLTG